jgi:hypothetical protein
MYRPAVLHGFVLKLPHEAAYREAWFAETGQPLPASIDFCVSDCQWLLRAESVADQCVIRI